jgi:hypothetical protein
MEFYFYKRTDILNFRQFRHLVHFSHFSLLWLPNPVHPVDPVRKKILKMNPFLNSFRRRRINCHSYHMLFNHSRFMGHMAVNVVQAALP